MSNKTEKLLLKEYNGLNAKTDFHVDSNGDIILRGVMQRADEENGNGRIYEKRLLEREITKYQQLIDSRRSIGECVPPDTEIFTKNGWKKIEEISEEEEIWTLNQETENLELQRITKKIILDYDDELITIQNLNLYIETTKNHKHLLWNRYNQIYKLSTEELENEILQKKSSLLHSYIKRSGNWDGEEPETIKIGDLEFSTEHWAAFLGIYIAEGYCTGTKGSLRKDKRIGICQKKIDSKLKIKNLLNLMNIKFNEYIGEFVFFSKDLHEHLLILGNSYNKFIPEYAKQWSPKLLSIMFDWMLIGDGRNRKTRKNELIQEYTTTSPKLADDVFEIILKLGSGASIHKQYPKDVFIENRLIKKENKKIIYIIYRHTSVGGWFNKNIQISKKHYTGKVYCVEVPNQTWLMKQNNKVIWTHNCDHPPSVEITLKNVSHLIREVWWEGNEIYGRIKLTSNSIGEDLKKLVANDGITLGISTRGFGSVSKKNNKIYVNEDYQLVCWDLVADPSTAGAFMLKEGKYVRVDERKLLSGNTISESKHIETDEKLSRIIDDILQLKK